jgi:hypothetical protein
VATESIKTTLSKISSALRDGKPGQDLALVLVDRIGRMARDPEIHLNEIHQGELYAMMKTCSRQFKWRRDVDDLALSCCIATWLNSLTDARALQPQPE